MLNKREYFLSKLPQLQRENTVLENTGSITDGIIQRDTCHYSIQVNKAVLLNVNVFLVENAES
jgi:hypothetical protein